MIGRRLQHAMVVRTATDDRPSLHHNAMFVLVLDGRQPLPRGTATDDRPSLHHNAMFVLVLDGRQPLPRAAPHGQNKHIVQASWLANTC